MPQIQEHQKRNTFASNFSLARENYQELQELFKKAHQANNGQLPKVKRVRTP
jgi:hypothetical protein